MSASYQIGAGGARIQVDFGPGRTAVGADSLLAWVERAARAVTVYYGRFPVPRYRVRVEMVPGANGVFGGTMWANEGGFPAFTRIHVGEQVTDGELISDGAMTREMVRTAFPAQPDSHAWMEAGLASYVGPVARVQAGFLHPEAVWAGMVRNMPQGNPQAGDKGLDHVRDRERTTWGGAQFCLLADVTMRGQTRNRKGLRDALRAIVDAGGTVDQRWPLTKALEVGDRATGTRVLMDQYDRMRNKPVRVDLAGLWRELGVVPVADGVQLNDAAPLAAVRRAITA